MRTEQNTTRIDPLFQYLDKLRWDGTPRIDTWVTTYLGAPGDEQTRTAGAAWLTQAVRRAYEPGCAADNVLVLHGPQGVGKTTALRILGGAWFTDVFEDAMPLAQQLFDKWIVDLGNFDTSASKVFVALREDYFRAPYTSQPIWHPRRFVFVRTINCNAPRDAISVTKFDAGALMRNRDQLWAEAIHKVRSQS